MNTTPPGPEQESLLYHLYQSLPIGVVFLDAGGKILSANRQFRRYFPYFTEGPYGLPLCRAVQCRNIHGCRECALGNSIQQMVAHNIPLKDTKWSCRGSKGTRWFQISGIQVKDANAKYAALFFVEITERVQQENALKREMQLDLSTGVLNRFGFIQTFQSLLTDGRFSEFTLCMTDLDSFKRINDRYGHPTGDKILHTFAETARSKIRSGDVIGRYGGDEFLFLFGGIPSRQAAGIIRRIQEELPEACRNIVSIPVTFSAGMVSWERNGQPDLQWEDCIKAVDRMLYRAKAEGKNRIAMT